MELDLYPRSIFGAQPVLTQTLSVAESEVNNLCSMYSIDTDSNKLPVKINF